MRDADHGAYGVEGREELICAYHFGGMGVKVEGGVVGSLRTYEYLERERERERGWMGEHKSAGSCFMFLPSG